MSTPVRTVMVAHSDAELGLPGRRLLETVTGLRRARYRVVVAVARDGPLVTPLHRAGAEVLIVPTLVLRRHRADSPGRSVHLRAIPAALLSTWRALARVDPQTVYASADDLPLWMILARLRRHRTLVHLRRAGRGEQPVGRLRLLPLLAAHRVLIDSPSTAKTLQQILPSLDTRTEIVLDAIGSPTRPFPPREPLEGPLRILFLGALTPANGPDLVLEAAARLHELGRSTSVTLFVTVAPEDAWFEERLQELTDLEDLTIEIERPGCSAEAFLAQADVVVLPTRLDGPFPVSAIDGILALRPVVIGDTEGTREALERYRTVRLVEPDDVEEIVEALTKLVDRWSEIVERLPTSRETALRRHAPSVYRENIARLCGSAAEGG
ncbi:glycosyltransferase family 4 protein [Brachybacterium vulturis]|nr:glycosyltransferase family 4 protein [Brachybacterium vulturis]